MAHSASASRRPTAFSLGLAILFSTVIQFALPPAFVDRAEANHPEGVCLDVDLETANRRIGETVDVTATLRARAGAPAADDACNGTTVNANNGPVNIDFRIEGPNDPNASNTSGVADLSCDIPEGQPSCTSPAYTGTASGTDLIRGWVDHDRIQTTIEADNGEGRDDVRNPGDGDQCSPPAGPPSPAEPDCTDVVSVTFTAVGPNRLDCDDAGPPDRERELNPSNEGTASNEVYTCSVTDAGGGAVNAQQVYGEVENGINDPDATDGASYSSPDYGCTAGSTSNTCTVTVTQNENENGTAEICFWIGTPAQGGDAERCGNEPTAEVQAADGSDVGNDPADQVEKTWEQRRASGIDAEPESATNSPGENHTITATVFDQFGQAFRGNTRIGFEFFTGSPSDRDDNTPASPDLTCTTQNSNTCSVTYTSQQPGTDLICVYPDPSQQQMTGNNTNGTCDGEGLTDPDDDPAAADAPEPGADGRVTDDQDVVQKRWAGAGEATRLDCSPETASNTAGTSHTITCTARNQANNVVGSAAVDAEATGANDPDNNADPTSPDFSCTTDANGTCSFTHGPGGRGSTTQLGTTTYRAWIDSDNNNSTAEADPAEGRDETAQPGNQGEPDNTDVVSKTWTGDARRIDCDPESATNPTETTHTVTCTVTDRGGSPVAGEGVTFSESGTGEIQGSGRATSDQSGRVTVTTTSNEPGEQTITGTLDDDTAGNEPGEVDECDRAANDPQGAPAGECADSVTKTWTESSAQCSDGEDNDSDGKTDHPDDPGCTSPDDQTEAPNPDDDERTRVATNLTIRYDRNANAFKGAAGSSRKVCQVGRTVLLKKITPGPNRTVGRDTTNRQGNWRMAEPRARGRYYGIVLRKDATGRNGAQFNCLRDRSVTIKVGRRR